jgi:5-methylcytosine-specific restriction protein A
VYRSIIEKSQRVIFEINEESIENMNEGSWATLELQIKYGFTPDENSMTKFKSVLLCAVGLLMPLFTEDINQDLEAISADWQEEGSLTRVETNRYERSRINRAICLDYYGFTCRGCGLLMNHMYGPLGEGVINVHHIVPVSEMGSSRVLDPIKDLIPLCPNCHTIVHKESPPISPEGLRKITGYQIST